MPNPFEDPFAESKSRKPGIAPLVGEVFGEKAEAAYVKRVSEGKKQRSAPVPQEDWEGVDITLSAAEKTGMEIEREHVRLHNIPAFTELPDEDAMKRDFNFDWIWKEEYRKGRPITDFALRGVDFVNIGLDEQASATVIEAMSKAKESPLLAKVFDIGEIIQQKRQADPDHPDYLITAEVLEAIDAAGYRPATFQELLAYGRDYWKPDVDMDDLTEEEEKRLKRANAPYIYAFGAPFTDSGSNRDVPCLGWDGSGRFLDSNDFNHVWTSDQRFLVFRKGSS